MTEPLKVPEWVTRLGPVSHMHEPDYCCEDHPYDALFNLDVLKAYGMIVGVKVMGHLYSKDSSSDQYLITGFLPLRLWMDYRSTWPPDLSPSTSGLS